MTTYLGIDISASTSAQIHLSDNSLFIYYDENQFMTHGVDAMVDQILKRAESEQNEHPDNVVWVTFYHDSYDEELDWDTYEEIASCPFGGYQPVVIGHDKHEEGFYVQVKDKTGWKPTVWIEVYGFGRNIYPIMDWNMYIFDMKNSHDREVHQFQRDAMKDEAWMWCLIEDTVLDHLMDNGLIDYDDDGICRMTN